MKVLGVFQFEQKKYTLLPLTGQFKATFGDLPKEFHCIVYGDSGHGKTEFCVQLAKYLTQFGEVVWMSYEQGHGYDLQKAIKRNNMMEVTGLFHTADPVENLEPGVSFREDLCNYLSKRNSPSFVFIDSVDYTEFTFDDYKELKTRFKKKTFVWISHIEGKHPKTTTGKKIKYDGGIGIRVKDFIAYPEKNRFGGFEPYVIYEERARVLNPRFFADKEAAKPPAKMHETPLNDGG